MTTVEPGVRGFLSPFEVPAPEGCEGWESMYPYYALFSDERRGSEEARGCFRDGMHFPEPMFPFDFITADSPYMGLGQANSRIFCVPPALGIDHRVLYGWVYMSANPVRPGRDRPAGRAVRPARGVLLPELGRALRALAGQGRRDDPRARRPGRPRPARRRGRGGGHRGPRDRFHPHAARCL